MKPGLRPLPRLGVAAAAVALGIRTTVAEPCAGPALAAELFDEHDWEACRAECERGLASAPGDALLRLMRAQAALRLGRDATTELADLAAGDATGGVPCRLQARLELARCQWGRSDVGAAVDGFLTVLHAADTPPALFARSACALNRLLRENPQLARRVPEVRGQVLTTAPLWTPAVREDSGPLTVAARIARQGPRPSDDALACRRLACGEPDGPRRAGYYWAAAHAYAQAADRDRAAAMLDRAENADPGLRREALLLRGQAALDSGEAAEAEFYLQTLLDSGATGPVATAATRLLAAARLFQQDVAGAAAALHREPDANAAPLAALERWRHTRDRSPALAAALNAVPGLGYAYAGEYWRAAGTFFLHAVLLAGMGLAAEDEQWGLFTALTLVEAPRYALTLRGGAAAARRANGSRLRAAAGMVRGNCAFRPDARQLPAVALQFAF